MPCQMTQSLFLGVSFVFYCENVFLYHYTVHFFLNVNSLSLNHVGRGLLTLGKLKLTNFNITNTKTIKYPAFRSMD